MQICDEGHEAVAFEGWCNSCPMCKLSKENKSLEDEVEGLRDEVSGLEFDMENQYRDFQRQLAEKGKGGTDAEKTGEHTDNKQ